MAVRGDCSKVLDTGEELERDEFTSGTAALLPSGGLEEIEFRGGDTVKKSHKEVCGITSVPL